MSGLREGFVSIDRKITEDRGAHEQGQQTWEKAKDKEGEGWPVSMVDGPVPSSVRSH